MGDYLLCYADKNGTNQLLNLIHKNRTIFQQTVYNVPKRTSLMSATAQACVCLCVKIFDG